MLETLAKHVHTSFLQSWQADRQRPTNYPHFNAAKFSQLGQAAAGKVFGREEGDARTHQERTAKTDETRIASSASHKTSAVSNPEQSGWYASNSPKTHECFAVLGS